MPHICTRCSNVFDLGEDILKGCPNCGWKKFLFVKKEQPDGKAEMLPPKPIINRAMGVRIPPSRWEKGSTAIEEEMQSSQNVIHQSDGKPEEKTLESVKITAPGTYELNLPSLFERDELIMAVKEGTYFIDLASVFKKSKKD